MVLAWPRPQAAIIRRRLDPLLKRSQRLSFVNAPLSFSFSVRRRPTSPINSRTTPIRSVCERRSSELGMPVVIPSLNHIFEPLTPPLARKFAPVTCRFKSPATNTLRNHTRHMSPRNRGNGRAASAPDCGCSAHSTRSSLSLQLAPCPAVPRTDQYRNTCRGWALVLVKHRNRWSKLEYAICQQDKPVELVH